MSRHYIRQKIKDMCNWFCLAGERRKDRQQEDEEAGPRRPGDQGPVLRHQRRSRSRQVSK